MKKIYYLGSLLLGLLINGQFTQAPTGTNGIVSNVLSSGSFVLCADDFTVSQATTVSSISVTGFQNAGTLETGVSTGLILYIYTDASGVPASNPTVTSYVPVAKIDITSTSPAYNLVKTGTNTYTFNVNVASAIPTAVTLQPGVTYWLAFAPKTNLTAYTATTRFNWFTATTALGNPAKLIDPGNAFGANATSWTDVSSLTADPSFDGLAFSIVGTTALGTTEEVFNSNKLSISPNPTSDILNIKTNSKINSVSVVDITGRKVNAKLDGDKVDVRSLPAGTYLINIETKDGISTEKFIKK
ncbi:hypothetical protein D3C71_14910 [compost metagenome]